MSSNYKVLGRQIVHAGRNEIFSGTFESLPMTEKSDYVKIYSVFKSK